MISIIPVYLTLPIMVTRSHYRTVTKKCFSFRKSHADKHSKTLSWINPPTKTRHNYYASEHPKIFIVIFVILIFHAKLSILLDVIKTISRRTTWTPYFVKELKFGFYGCIQLSSYNFYFFVSRIPV